MTALTFGALWGPTCRNELPELDAFAAANSDRLTFYMVDSRGRIVYRKDGEVTRIELEKAAANQL